MDGGSIGGLEVQSPGCLCRLNVYTVWVKVQYIGIECEGEVCIHEIHIGSGVVHGCCILIVLSPIWLLYIDG